MHKITPKPNLKEYTDWLEKVWGGDARELRKGRFLHQQGDLARAFEVSPFWKAVDSRLSEWALTYERKTKFRLFAQGIPDVAITTKTWESFQSRTWRENVRNNPNWPEAPSEGWLLPDTWFERLWDIVRTRLVVRYLDGVEFLAEVLENLATEYCPPPRRVIHAQEWGYYAVHVVVPQSFRVQALNYDYEEDRSSEVEIQITTELQETISQLTHPYFERRREEYPSEDQAEDLAWQWNYASSEFTPYYLGHLLHYLEGMIMKTRSEVHGAREDDGEATR
ncbi:MAG TPA: hypothetical protein VJ777_04755 [Mycobacterium sp.]|nr:hypothetical protein [Mycobacterium sp.]